MTTAITDRQRQVLEAIARLMQQNGYCPTVREIGEATGLASSCSVQRHLDALERKGCLRRTAGKARRIELLGEWATANCVRVIGGMLSSFRNCNRIRIEGVRYPLAKGEALDGHIVEFDLMRRLGMVDEDNGKVRTGRLWFEADVTEGPGG